MAKKPIPQGGPAQGPNSSNEEQKKPPTLPNEEEIAKLIRQFDIRGTKLVIDHPFYGSLLLNLIMKPCGTEIPTAAVNYRNLFICAVDKERDSASLDWKNLSPRAQSYVLCHEILHLVFEHISAPRSLNQELTNIAMDAVINSILNQDPTMLEAFRELPDGIVNPDDSGFTVGSGPNQRRFNIPGFKQKDWMGIYKELLKQVESESKAKGISVSQLGQAIASLNPLGSDVDLQDGVDPDSSEHQQEKSRFQIAVQNAVENAQKARGTIPAGVEDYVNSLHNSKINWRSKLRSLTETEVSNSDFKTWSLRRAHLSGNRLRPFVNKILKDKTIKDIVCILDTSGSMGIREIEAGLTEFAAMRNSVPFNLHFITCDADVHDHVIIDRYENIDFTKLPIRGRGGSDFIPAFEYIDRKIEDGVMDPAMAVFFTDGYITFRDEGFNFKTLVLSTSDCSHYLKDYMELIIMDDLD